MDNAHERELLLILQNDFPLVLEPFAKVAERLSVEEGDVLKRVQELKAKRVIRRIGAVFDQAALGYKSVLATMCVAPERLEEVASYVSSFKEVTHNYSRKSRYNLWFTITASSQERIQEIVRAIEEFAGCSLHLLRAKRTFKVRTVFDI